MKSATERDEFDFSRYVKEFDDQNLPLMIDRPLDNTSIKKSVLWTGKPQEEIEKELEETKLLPKVSNEKYTETPKQIINPQQMIRPPNQMMRPPSFTSPPHQPISGNVIATDMTAPQQRVSIDDYIKGLEQKEKEKAKKEELFKPLDYKVPTNPIIYNPNVIKAMPTVPTQPLQPGGIGTTNGSYYNTYINPYAFQNQGFNVLQGKPRKYFFNNQLFQVQVIFRCMVSDLGLLRRIRTGIFECQIWWVKDFGRLYLYRCKFR